MGVTTTSTVAQTYVPLQSITLTTSASTVTFGSGGTIPQIYTDLLMIINAGTTSGTITSGIQFNSDTSGSSTNYSFTAIYGDGSSAGPARYPNNSSIFINYYAEATTALLSQTVICHIQNYANTNTNKTIICRASSAPSGVSAIVGLWRATTAINSIVVKSTSANNYAAGSMFTLYGIKAA
jgi:hypothetical protein